MTERFDTVFTVVAAVISLPAHTAGVFVLATMLGVL